MGLSRHTGPVQAVSWASNGIRIVTAGDDGYFIWQAMQIDAAEQRWDAVISIGREFGGILAAAWSPDSTYVATAGVDAVVRVWGCAADGGRNAHVVGGSRLEDSWEMVASLEGHHGAIVSLAWSPDG